MQLRRLDHVTFHVSDVARSRQFYGQVLGLTELARPDTFTFPGAWFGAGDFQVHLIGEVESDRVRQLNPGSRADELARGYAAHAAFEVDDLEATIAHLRQSNIAIVGGPGPRGDGVQQIWISDPDRYVIELFARDA